ncbi:MAG TPA: DUF998 domain-containing protein [Candidatus Limnocylindrales bacterium]|nr:DUF998 domain-containing protein [Candidatus Limnocylindrales bacterium]
MTSHAQRFRAEGVRPAASTGNRPAAGLLLLVLGAAFLTVTMMAASIAPRYDFHGGAISDLGVIDQTAMLFNGLLVAVGALNIGAGYLLYRWHRRTWIFAIYGLAGLGAAGAGLLPLDSGTAHSLFALFAFLFFNLEALATATVVRGGIRALSIVAGTVGLLYVVVMVIGDSGNPAIFGAIGHGGAERMIVYPAMLWTLVLGGYLLARSDG